MTVTGRSLAPQRLRRRYYEWKWKLLNPRWLTWQSLCPQAFPTMGTKHSLCLVWLWFCLGALPTVIVYFTAHFSAVNPANRLGRYLRHWCKVPGTPPLIRVAGEVDGEECVTMVVNKVTSVLISRLSLLRVFHQQRYIFNVWGCCASYYKVVLTLLGLQIQCGTQIQLFCRCPG